VVGCGVCCVCVDLEELLKKEKGEDFMGFRVYGSPLDRTLKISSQDLTWN